MWNLFVIRTVCFCFVKSVKMRHMLGTTFVWLLLMIGHAGASPITTGVFFPRDETATAGNLCSIIKMY